MLYLAILHFSGSELEENGKCTAQSNRQLLKSQKSENCTVGGFAFSLSRQILLHCVEGRRPEAVISESNFQCLALREMFHKKELTLIHYIVDFIVFVKR